MAVTTFSGPLRVGNSDTAPGTVSAVRVLPITVTATPNTDLTIAMPTGYMLQRIVTYTTTAFTGATVTAQVGTAAGGAQVVAAANIKAAGTVAHALVAGFLGTAMNMTATTLYVRVVQTTETAVGAATMVFEYVPIAA